MSKISELTEGKWPKTSIIEALQAHGIKKSDTPIPSKPKYGYKVENGELVLCEKEQKIIKLILELHDQDNSLRNIARILNEKKIKGKYGGLWDKSVISTIIKRETKQEE
ncbi:recombinase family protein [Halobacteriovorax marinus]|nr:recombinase family protein [Halobacteriovorax marinus]